MKAKRIDLILLGILILAAFFRFYNFYNLQYWNGDDEVFVATIRHIVWDRSPSLLVQNSFLGFGLGPFFTYILVPFYYLLGFRLTLILGIAGILGIASTYLIYKAGVTIKNRELGLIASFLYASSFMFSLFDRRLWALSLDFSLAAVSLIAILKVAQKDFRFIPVLALPIGFSFHADPSMLTLTITIFVAWVLFKFPVFNRYTYFFFLIIALFISPLVLAEFRYNGAVSGPVMKSITRPARGVGVAPGHNFRTFSFSDSIDTFSRSIFIVPDRVADKYWCHSGCTYPKPLFTPFTQGFVVLIFAFNLILLFKNHLFNKKWLRLEWLFMTSFALGQVIFNRIFKANFNQLYFLPIFPVFILFFAQAIFSLQRLSRSLIILLLLIYLMINIYSLFNSSLQYPLRGKIELVRQSLVALEDKNFSIKASSEPDVEGGGWTELFVLEGRPPVASYWFDYWEWIYSAYSLYPGPIQQEEPELSVIIQKNYEQLPSLQVIESNNLDDIVLFVVNNSRF